MNVELFLIIFFCSKCISRYTKDIKTEPLTAEPLIIKQTLYQITVKISVSIKKPEFFLRKTPADFY